MGVTIFELGEGWSAIDPIQWHVHLVVGSSYVQPERKNLPLTSTAIRATDAIVVDPK
jgi:hypothetical protein